MDSRLVIKKEVSACIPSKYGPFELTLFTTNQDNKEHLLLTFGKVDHIDNVLVRIHSECITGDILGSLRCDCGEQLQNSMSQISIAGCGIIIYLRQEGRGIGLAEKLRSYNLQDSGKDTVDANIALGYKDDERTYEIAAYILKALQIKSIRLLTNNPHKIAALTHYNVKVTARVPVKSSIHAHNAFYLLTKKKKMQHVFEEEDIRELSDQCTIINKNNSPFVTLAYAQSLDGSISCNDKERLILSSHESLIMTHKLRSENDAILVGIGTIIADDPLLTVRYYQGPNPQVIILDSQLRTPTSARVLKNDRPPIIFTTKNADSEKYKVLRNRGIKIIYVDTNQDDTVTLNSMLKKMYDMGIKKLMVEGGRNVITSFMNEKKVDKVIITLAPIFVGGVSLLSKNLNAGFGFPKLKNIVQYKLGNDIIIQGDIVRGRLEK